MQFGVCGDVKRASVAASAGYDYMEGSVSWILQPTESEDIFSATLETVRAAELPFPVANGFIPGDIKITGPDADMGKLTEFVTTAMPRAQKVGIEVIVFGSGGARRIPEGFDRAAAHEQIVAFCNMVAPLAQDHGVTIVVEPLCDAECNVLTRVGECADLVREVDHPAVRLLVDAYHHMKDGDSIEDIKTNASLLGHTHIATIPNRKAPGAEPCDLAPFFNALKEGGYDGRVSIEGRIDEDALPKALEVMKSYAQ